MKLVAFTILCLAVLGAEPNCQQQVGQRGMEEAADRIGQKIEAVGNKIDPLTASLVRLVDKLTDLLPAPGSACPATPSGAGAAQPATGVPAPTLPWWLSGEFVTAMTGAFTAAVSGLYLAHKSNAKSIQTNKESLSGKVSKVPTRESVAKRSK